MPSLLSCIIAASACLHIAAASPLYQNSDNADIGIRATYNCTDLRADPDTRCWDELNIPDYLARWNKTTPTCSDADGDGSDCCVASEPWTRCFLRLSYGVAGSDCTDINPQACVLNQLSPNLPPSIAPMVGYVVRNIVIINNLFSSYYMAFVQAGTTISGSDGQLSTFASIFRGGNGKGPSVNAGNVEKAYLIGLPFWATMTVLASGSQQINPPVNPTAAKAFAQSLLNTQAVSSLLLGTPYNSSVTENGLSASFDEAGAQLQSALGRIMSDVPTFSAWAAHGLYSGPTSSLFLSQSSLGITSAFITYFVGEVLSQNQFSATPASTTVSKQAFQQGRTCTTLGDVCKDSKGITYYWSQAYQTQYQINEPKNWAANGNAAGKHQPVIQQLGFEASAFGLLGYFETTATYMPVLFDGAYNCTLEGKSGTSAVNFNADGSLDVACLSSLPIYLPKGSSCPAGAVQQDGKCPFGFQG